MDHPETGVVTLITGRPRTGRVTSVKEVRVERAATADSLGAGAFVFSDRYSVFDWGEMPDHVPGKGKSLCAMGARTFERLDADGVPTHYHGVVDPELGEVSGIDDVVDPPRRMAIDLTQVPELPRTSEGYDYDAYHRDAGDNYLIPLEVVVRNRVPVGSSLRRRSTPADHGLDVRTWPDVAVDLSDPVVEFSTKYEASDRYLDREEAARIAGRADLQTLERRAREVNRAVTDVAARAGLDHQDGKIECLYYRGETRVADVAGTLDENRFAHEGRQVSKEVLRQHHKRTRSGWVEAVADAKARASTRSGQRGEAGTDWRQLCERAPDPLDEAVVEAVAELYAAAANAYVGRDLFDAPALETAVAAVEDIRRGGQ
jgi:phosphoribosylaminoimidazole-succinocarboxamide synthase